MSCMEEKLEDKCKQLDFHINILGNIYCQLALRRRVECPNLAEYKDRNGFWPCLNLQYVPLSQCYKA